MMRWFLLIAALVALGVAGARWPLFAKSEAKSVPDSALFAVRRGDLNISVTETGYLKAKNSINLAPKFRRQGTISWLVEEGKSVIEGEKLVEFDASELDNQISELENALIQYQIELEAAEAELGIQTRDNEAAIEKARLALEAAELAMERYRDGDAPTQLQKLALAQEKAESEFQRATERFRQVPELRAEGFLTKIQEEEERIRLREAEIEMQNARRELELHEKYTYPMDLKEKETAVKDTKRELENAQIKAQIHLKEKQARVEQEKLKIQSSTNRLGSLRDDKTNMTILAPSPGVVHYGDPAQPWYSDDVKVGETMWPGRTVITLPDLREMQIVINVHEAEISKLKLDLPVDVTAETQRGLSFQGTVSNIAAVASSGEYGDDNQKSFKVEITLGASDIELRAGTSAKAEIQIEQLKQVLYVPLHAVQSEAGKHFCFVLADGLPVERIVEIGKSNAHYIEITAGLTESEPVLLYDPRRESGVEGPADDSKAEVEAVAGPEPEVAPVQ